VSRAPWTPGPAWLFCPADRPDRYPKALACADVVVLDLEDAVAPDGKAAARASLRALAQAGTLDLDRTVVRVNAASSAEHLADVEVLRETGIPVVMVAKCDSPGDLSAVADLASIPLLESSRGIAGAVSIAASNGVVAVMWGADDLVADLGGTSSRRGDGSYRDVARHARSTSLLAAKAAGRLAIDAVFMDIADVDGLRAQCEDAVAVGFDVTIAIHPTQVPVIRSTYFPSPDEVERAHRLLAAATSGGVTTFEGRMVDGPIIKQAQRVLLRARSQGER